MFLSLRLMSLSVLWPNRLFTFFHFSEVNHLTMCYPPSYSHRHQLLPHTGLDSLAHVIQLSSSVGPAPWSVRAAVFYLSQSRLLPCPTSSEALTSSPAFHFLLSLLFIPSCSPHFTSAVQCLYSSQVLPMKVYCIEQTLLGGWRWWHRRSN